MSEDHCWRKELLPCEGNDKNLINNMQYILEPQFPEPQHRILHVLPAGIGKNNDAARSAQYISAMYQRRDVSFFIQQIAADNKIRLQVLRRGCPVEPQVFN